MEHLSLLPTLVVKALTDSGYDLLSPSADGWFEAGVSGSSAKAAVRVLGQDRVLLAFPEPGVTQRVGLPAVPHALPRGMLSLGLVADAAQLYNVLRMLHALQTSSIAALSARVAERLATISATERTLEVRQRIGQDVFREALMELWQGRCALCGVQLPPCLLRASHAIPWALANAAQRLDPFNGLLLAVHYDALFDQGLITFDDDGRLLMSSALSQEARQILSLHSVERLRFVLPGHQAYLRFHREEIAML